MPTVKRVLYLLFTLLAAVLMLLVSCPADGQQSNSNPQPAAQSTADSASNTSTPDAGAVPEPVPGPAVVVEEPKPEEKEKEDPPADDEADEKPPMSKNFRPVEEKKAERPAKIASRKKSFVSVELRLLSADYNPAENATLSKLAFEFRANLGRMKKLVKNIELSSVDEAVFAEIDLGLCKLEIYPSVQPPRLDGVGSLGAVGLRMDGMYHIRMYSPEDELIGIFGIRSDGEFSAAPLMERPEGYLIKSVRRENNYAPIPYTVYKKTPKGERPEYLVTIQFSDGGFDQRQVEDPDKNLYNYYFPSGRLELYDPNEL